MNQSIQQFKAVFRKGFLGQTQQKSLILNIGIPLFCGLSAYMPYLSKDVFGWMTFLQFFYFPMALSGFFRNMIMAIVVEKQDKLKENQFIMGLKPIPYYFGWFSFIFSFAAILQFFYLIPAYYGFEIREAMKTNFFYVLIEYSFYLFSLTGQMLLVSSFFSDGRKANEFYGLLSILLGCGIFLEPMVQEYTTLVFSFFPQTLLWASIPSIQLQYFRMTYGQILGVQFLQGIIQFTLYIYIDQIMPNDLGNQKNILFFLKCLFKKDQNLVLIEEQQFEIQQPELNLQTGLMNVANDNYGINFDSEEIEDQKIGQVLVCMDQVCKYYDGRAVVNKLTLNLNENEIFCLLGHNGAGKSTTINILTGMIKKASGKITICGFNLEEDIDQIRNLIGYCSQKDVLYPMMNVYEQIKYYAQIKLVPDHQIHEHVMTIIQKCHLEQEKTQLAMYLSGGGKRKLCLAISLVGNSKVIFLDEPTSGLDPLARQQIWGILKDIKKDRCIILTTHYLDEAQELADYVGIIQEGSLIVNGTVEQIKRRFSVGYHLTLECKDEDQTNRIKIDVEKILHSITQRPIQCLKQNTILRTIIPQEFQKKIGGIFRELEEFPQTKLSFEMNTLEDAYINIHLNFPGVNQQVIPVRNDNINIDVKPKYSFGQQLKSSMLKKHYVQMQNKWMIISNFGAWIILIIIYKLLARSINKKNPFIMIVYFVIIKTLFQTNYTYVPIYERQTKIKETQIIMGMRVIEYWLGILIYDMIPIALETVWYIILLYLLFDMQYLNIIINQIVILNFVFMVSLNCFSYAISLLFDSTRKAYIYIPLLLFLSQIIGSILQMIIFSINGIQQSQIVGLLIPYFGLFNGYTIIFTKTAIYLPIPIFYLILSGFLYFGITILYEYRKYNIQPDNPQVSAIQVNDLTKIYGTKLVVKGINFEVQEKQIFGLLGPNGAGKTTTFNMLSKFDKPTAGTVKIKNQINEIGVIPQFSPLYNEMTLVQHLRIYGLIKGMSSIQIDQFIDQFCQTLNMEGVKDRQVKFLSGGERRKSQLAICLIGGSSKLFLDEPSSGLDPVSRQSLQEVLLRNCQENGSSTVITTHSMQEAQRICEVIGIMINGKFICKGSLGELREIFGNAFRVSVKLQSDDTEDATKQLFQKELLANNIEPLDEVRKNYVTYKVNSQNIKISQLFSLCESDRMQRLISDYSIYQISLEQIFQYFANQQEATYIADNNDPRIQANCLCCRLLFAPCCLN